MPRITGGEALVHGLVRHGVDTLFGLPGVQTYYLYDVLYDVPDKIRVIHTRHEQATAYMALGYALSSERVGVYNVVPGPGFLNTTAALSTAYACNAKVLALAGQLPSNYIGRDLGLLHEIPDQTGVLDGLTKWSGRINTPAEAPALTAEAFRQLHNGRPRPVGLELPLDVLADVGETDLSPEAGPPVRPPVDTEMVEQAARLLAGAKQPLIFVGSGAGDAGESVRHLAELLQAPVVAGLTGRGILSNRHALSLTHPAGYQLWKTADVVLAVGCRLQTPLNYWGYDDEMTFIRIDVDPEAHRRTVPTEVSLVADADDALKALIPAVEKHMMPRPSRTEDMKTLKAAMHERFAYLEPQLSFINVIREELPDEGIFVDEMTQIGYVSGFAMPFYEPRTFLSPSYQGTLGWGFATALGAKVANPDTPVVSVNGDGGFLFNVQELATAVQHEIGVVALVFNDNGYGNVRTMQRDLFDGRVIGGDLHNPDFVRLAETFGAQGLRATTPEELRAALRKGFETKGPTLIEIPCEEMPGPWPLIRMPQVRGYPKPAPDALKLRSH